MKNTFIDDVATAESYQRSKSEPGDFMHPLKPADENQNNHNHNHHHSLVLCPQPVIFPSDPQPPQQKF